MTKLMLFENKEFGKIRIIMINGEAHFVLKDITEILGRYLKKEKVIKANIDKEDIKVVLIQGEVDKTQKQEISVINGKGLYSLIFSSKLPIEKKFKYWITSEVLPEIGRTDIYNSNGYSRKSKSLGDVLNIIQITREIL